MPWPPKRNVRRASSPHAATLSCEERLRALPPWLTRRGLEVLAERKPGHGFLGGEAEARRVVHDDQRSAVGDIRGNWRVPRGVDLGGAGEVHVGRNADAGDDPGPL